jgi:purine nucleoside permease
VLRTISNYDREAPGVSVSDSLKALSAGNYSAYLPALDAAEIVGDKVVRDIVTHWEQRAAQIPHAP